MIRRWHVIARLCRKHGLSIGAEVGVADGRFTDAALTLSPSLTLLAVDDYAPGYKTWSGEDWTLEQQEANKSDFAKVLAAHPGRIRFIGKPSVDAASDIEDASLDFVFIDADHSYAAVKADIRAWLPKVRPGGFVTGHDYDTRRFPGVVQAVIEDFAEIKVQEDYVWMARKA